MVGELTSDAVPRAAAGRVAERVADQRVPDVPGRVDMASAGPERIQQPGHGPGRLRPRDPPRGGGGGGQEGAAESRVSLRFVLFSTERD